MNVIIIPLAGHYRRFLFLFLCVNLFKRKLFVTTICSLKINKPHFFFFKTRMVKMVSLGLRFSSVGLSPVCVAGKPMASSLGCCWKPAEMGWRFIAGQPALLRDLPGMWVVDKRPALPTCGLGLFRAGEAQGLPGFPAQPVCGVCSARMVQGGCSAWHTSKPGFESHVGAARLIPHPRGN